MTAAMVGMGALLWTRHRLARREGELQPVARADARRAGFAVLIVTGVSAVLVLGIVVQQWLRGGQLGALSLAMPAVGLLWLLTLGLQSLGHRDRSVKSTQRDRPSRRPPQVDGLQSPSQRPSRPPTDRRLSA